MAKRRREDWSKEEERFLIQNYPTMTQKEIGEKLHRTWRAVHSHAYKILKLNKWKMALKTETIHVKELIKKLDPVEIGYLSGLIDGEGSLTAQIQVKRTGLSIIPKMSISNTNLAIIDWLTKTALFKNHSGRSDTRFPNAKPIYQCETRGFRLLPLLEALAPYLIGKKEHAELLSLFIRLRLSHKRTAHFTKEEIELVRRLIQLNKGYVKTLKKLEDYERKWLHD